MADIAAAQAGSCEHVSALLWRLTQRLRYEDVEVECDRRGAQVRNPRRVWGFRACTERGHRGGVRPARGACAHPKAVPCAGCTPLSTCANVTKGHAGVLKRLQCPVVRWTWSQNCHAWALSHFLVL